MANEISIQVTASCTNGGYAILPAQTMVGTADQSVQGKNCAIQIVGYAAHEALALGDVTTPGWCMARNLDATNAVKIGVDVSGTFYPLINLPPGGAPVLFHFASAAVPYVKAATAACRVQIDLLEA